MFRQAANNAARSVGVRTFANTAVRPDLARMQLLGRLVADPEQRTARNGKDYIKYTVATSDPTGPPNEEGERPPQTTSFHNVFAFGESAMARLANLTKGTQVIVDADFRVQYQPNENGEGGSTNYLVQHRSLSVVSRPRQAEPTS